MKSRLFLVTSLCLLSELEMLLLLLRAEQSPQV